MTTQGGVANAVAMGVVLGIVVAIATVLWKTLVGKLRSREKAPTVVESVDVVGIDDTEFYAQAAQEADTGSKDPGLWAKAFATAEGELQKTKAHYIRMRAQQLLKQSAVRSSSATE